LEEEEEEEVAAPGRERRGGHTTQFDKTPIFLYLMFLFVRVVYIKTIMYYIMYT
jgi:hypothetical protein